MKKIIKIEDSIIKDVRNLFRLKKEIDDNTTKGLKSFLEQKRKMKKQKKK